MTATPSPVVLITGAAGGIGAALAERWVSEGARLALLDVDAAGAEAVAARLRDRGAAAAACACDVTEPAACRAAVAAATDRFGGLDVVVANAGRTHLGPVAETDADVFRRVMDVNFFGAVHVVQAALPALLERRGRIVVMSSVAGFAPLVGRAGYAASKHALHGFFDSVRGELAPRGVSVTLVCPSFTRTGIGAAAIGPDGGPARGERTELGRPMEPAEVADAVVRAARLRRRLVVLSPVGRLSWIVSRLAPRAYEALMLRALARGRSDRGR